MSDLSLVREWDSFLAAQGRSTETRRTYRYALLRFLSETLPPSIATVTETDVAAFLASFKERAAARSTYFRGLRSFFSWCAARGHVAQDPTALIHPKDPTPPPVVALSEEELTRYLIAAAWRSPRRAWALILKYGTGTRRMELAHIRPQDVDFGDSSVLLRRTKGGRPRRVELGPLARTALEELRPWWNGTILGGVNEQTVTDWAHDAAVDSGLYPKLRYRTSHVLRATFATRLLEQGTPISVVAELLGHSDVSITTRYLAVNKADRRRAVEGLKS